MMTTDIATDREIEQRAETLFQRHFVANARNTDRLFVYLTIFQWLLAIGFAIWLSPYAWSGKTSAIHLHVPLAIFGGATIAAAPIALGLLRPGWVGTRYSIAFAQMLWSVLLIHLSGGRSETHFHIFGSLAFLAFYRDWRVLVPATLLVAADHGVRQFLWPESVYGMSNPEAWRFLEHTLWVIFEDVGLVIAISVSVTEMRKIARQQVTVERTLGATRELEIASTIQSSILPKTIDIEGLDVATQMIPTDRVGGDYYDLLPVEGGCWIAIGDVAGHGVRAGLAMLQAQAALAALVRQAPDARPSDLWRHLNGTFFDNVRKRLGNDEHMTMSLLRFHDDGRLELVGAHEELLIWRHAENTCEVIPLAGTWIGVSPRARCEERALRLHEGDVLVLYTDGIIEARSGDGEMLGLDAVRDVVVRDHAKSPSAIRDAIFDLTHGNRDDDASVLVLRYRGTRRASIAA